MRIDTGLHVGIEEYEIVFDDKVSTFKMNAADPAILSRIEIAGERIKKIADENDDELTEGQAEALLSKAVKEAINYILADDTASDTIFGDTSPFNVCSDGRLFYMVIFGVISDIVSGETLKRKQLSEKLIDKYLKDYE